MRLDLLRNHCQRLRKTRWPDFFDQLVNSAENAGRSLHDGIHQAGNYVLSTLRLRQRSDPFFLSMQASIASFHRAFRANDRPPSDGLNGLAIVEWCERAACAAGISSSRPRFSSPLSCVESDDAEILITGASGFIGKHLVKRLLDDGYRLRV